MRICHEKVTATLKQKLEKSEAGAIELQTNLETVLKEFEEKLTAKNVEIDGEKREKERILKEVDVKNKDFQSRTSQMEGELKMKDNELEKAKKEHADFVKEVNDNSEDINLLRLRKTHAELKKDLTN